MAQKLILQNLNRNPQQTKIFEEILLTSLHKEEELIKYLNENLSNILKLPDTDINNMTLNMLPYYK